jgi:16S rRNA processing protein RimM
VAPTDATAHRLSVATIVGVHGIKGWVKVRINLEDPASLSSLSPTEISDPRRQSVKSVTVTSVRAQGKGYIAKLLDVNDRTQAELLRGYSIDVPESSLPRLETGEFYWRDLLGCRVEAVNGDSQVIFGRVDHLLETGANDVLVVKPTSDSIDDRQRLIPWLEGDVVRDVNLQGRCISVKWHIDD